MADKSQLKEHNDKAPLLCCKRSETLGFSSLGLFGSLSVESGFDNEKYNCLDIRPSCRGLECRIGKEIQHRCILCQ